MNVSPARRIGTRAAAGAAAAALVVLATPGSASAATTAVTPLLDCYMQNSDGSYTAVLGYNSTYGSAQSIPVGTRNTFSPTSYNGRQPTSYEAGVHHAAFSVKVYSADIATGVTWTLDGTTLNYAAAAYASGICAPGTSLPAEGNGTGWTIALAGAGLVAGAAAWRARRRSVRGATAEGPAVA